MVQSNDPDLSPTQEASMLPFPALLVSKPKPRVAPNSMLADGADTSLTLSAAGSSMLILKGLPLTCSPPHFTLTSYMSGSGGVNSILYLSSPAGVTSTGTCPTFSPMHTASSSPPPAADVSMLTKSVGTPASKTGCGSATTATFSATGGRRLILKGEPGMCSPDQVTFRR